METFNKYMISDTIGFNLQSATNVLREAGVVLEPQVIKQQFDLAQQTVFDEHLGAAEYSDMELVEFLEFLVRISYVMPNKDADPTLVDVPEVPIAVKLGQLLAIVLPLAKFELR